MPELSVNIRVGKVYLHENILIYKLDIVRESFSFSHRSRIATATSTVIGVCGLYLATSHALIRMRHPTECA